MFLGHFAVGLAAKKMAPKTSLGTSFIACQLLDLIWPLLILAGMEKAEINPGQKPPINFTHYPYSHSLSFVLLWAALFGSGYYFLRKDRRSALVIAGLVVSHWLLDLIVHRPDLPLTPSGVLVGFSLWNNFLVSFFLEIVLFFIGAFLFWKSAAPKNKKGKYLLLSLLFFLFVIHLANVFGPPHLISWPWQLQVTSYGR